MTIKQQGGIFGRNPTFKNVSATDLNVSTLTATTANTSTLTTTAAIIDNYVDIKSSGTVRGNIYADASNMYINTQGTNTNLNANGGNVILGNANLVINTSGKGIDFSATSGTGTSELFDDYEEGTWTPVLSDANSGGNTATLGSSTAHYVKVGSVVHLFLQIINVNNSGMTGGNTLYIQGLPYTSVSSNNSAGSAVFDRVSVSGFYAVTPAIGPNRDYMTLATTTTGTSDGNLTVAAFNNSSSDIQNLHISYRA